MNNLNKFNFLKYSDIALNNMRNIIRKSPLELNYRLSKEYNCNLYIKREDLQQVRSFKIRGAFNKISNIDQISKNNGVVCASAGNHAQGVAYSCKKLGIEGNIFIPEKSPLQKVNRIKYFGGNLCKVNQIGKNFNECLEYALQFSEDYDKEFIHPYNDPYTIIGQSTIAKEICDDINPDFIIGTIGGGGMMSGISLHLHHNEINCKTIGAEANTCDAMFQSIKRNKIIEIDVKDNFIDGATVSKVGDLTFEICKKYLDNIYVCDVGKVCQDILDLYQNDGIVAEPAGAIPFSILDELDRDEIEGKNVVCIMSGGNNDLSRYPEIMERCLQYQGLKQYYLIEFAQTPGQLKKFINNILKGSDDISRFEYVKKTNKEFGDVLVGIQVSNKFNIVRIDNELKKNNFRFIKINDNDLLYSYLI